MSVLAVLLLVCSSLASACELQCNLLKAHVCCAPNSSEQTMNAMPGMERLTSPSVEAASCVQHVCPAAVAWTAERADVEVPPAPSVEVVRMDVAVPVMVEAWSPAFVRGPPLGPLASPVALHILSRV